MQPMPLEILSLDSLPFNRKKIEGTVYNMPEITLELEEHTFLETEGIIP